MKNWEDFKTYTVVDYEYYGVNGDLPKPICYTAAISSNNSIIRHWINGNEITPQYPTDNNTLFIAYYSSAEFGCHEVLGFKNPL